MYDYKVQEDEIIHSVSIRTLQIGKTKEHRQRNKILFLYINDSLWMILI